jgi:serine/threonine-protein kinase
VRDTLHIGEVLDGKYEIVRELGAGAMGVVYVARHQQLRRQVAVKILRGELARDEHLASRFEQEARAASAIGHPNIIDVYDLGRSADGLLFMVMELLEGQSLGDVLHGARRLTVPRAVKLTEQILSGLAAAHKAGIVHRDLKPDNVFVVSSEYRPDFVKLLDFGISKILARAAEALGDAKRGTVVGTVMGTPEYMSPEQARGLVDQVDARTDVYAAGVVLYELLCGKPPFCGDNYNAVMAAIIDGTFVKPRDVRSGIPAKVEQVILKAMGYRREERWQTAAAMREALEWAMSDGKTPGGGAPVVTVAQDGDGASKGDDAPVLELDATGTGATLAPPGAGPPPPSDAVGVTAAFAAGMTKPSPRAMGPAATIPLAPAGAPAIGSPPSRPEAASSFGPPPIADDEGVVGLDLAAPPPPTPPAGGAGSAPGPRIAAGGASPARPAATPSAARAAANPFAAPDDDVERPLLLETEVQQGPLPGRVSASMAARSGVTTMAPRREVRAAGPGLVLSKLLAIAATLAVLGAGAWAVIKYRDRLPPSLGGGPVASFQLQLVPAEAEASLDGRRLDQPSFSAGAGRHVLEVRAPGYVPRRVLVDGDQPPSAPLVVRLSRQVGPLGAREAPLELGDVEAAGPESVATASDVDAALAKLAAVRDCVVAVAPEMQKLAAAAKGVTSGGSGAVGAIDVNLHFALDAAAACLADGRRRSPAAPGLDAAADVAAAAIARLSQALLGFGANARRGAKELVAASEAALAGDHRLVQALALAEQRWQSAELVAMQRDVGKTSAYLVRRFVVAALFEQRVPRQKGTAFDTYYAELFEHCKARPCPKVMAAVNRYFEERTPAALNDLIAQYNGESSD